MQPSQDLTDAEKAVLELLKQGATNLEIADSLSITSGKASSLTERVIKKLGVRTRDDLLDANHRRTPHNVPGNSGVNVSKPAIIHDHLSEDPPGNSGVNVNKASVFQNHFPEDPTANLAVSLSSFAMYKISGSGYKVSDASCFLARL